MCTKTAKKKSPTTVFEVGKKRNEQKVEKRKEKWGKKMLKTRKKQSTNTTVIYVIDDITVENVKRFSRYLCSKNFII